MNRQEHLQLQAELGALEKMLATIPIENVIERSGLEERRQEVEALLAAAPSPRHEPVRARLTFRGKPIVGRYGIFAEFGAAAVSAFVEAVAAIGASQSGPLGTRGVLPRREDFQMLITGTAPGSFGFQLEEAPQNDAGPFAENSVLASAIDQTQTIMRATTGSDDDLTEALSDADPRALDAIRKFFDTIERSEAICALEYKDKTFRFTDLAEVRKSRKRLQQDNIHECDDVLTGQFLGVLPKRRTFEFLRNDTGEIIAGKVGRHIDDPSQINEVLNKKVNADMHCRRVGEGRPRFVLVDYKPDEDAGA